MLLVRTPCHATIGHCRRVKYEYRIPYEYEDIIITQLSREWKRSEFSARWSVSSLAGRITTIPNQEILRAALPLRRLPINLQHKLSSIFLSLLLVSELVPASPFFPSSEPSPSPSPTGSSPPERFFWIRNQYHTTLTRVRSFTKLLHHAKPSLAHTPNNPSKILLPKAPQSLTLVPDSPHPSDRPALSSS